MNGKKRNKKYNPYKKQDMKLQIFEITPTQYCLNLLGEYVKRGYLTCQPVQIKGLAEFNHEYHLIIYLLQHLFFLQLCKHGDNKIRKYFISIRESLCRYVDKIANNSYYNENDIIILPTKVDISPILAGKIIFVVNNNYKLMTGLTSREYVDLVTEGASMFNIWCGINIDNNIHLLLDYNENIKVSNEISEYMKIRQFKNKKIL